MPSCSCWFLIAQLFNPHFILFNPTLLRFYWAVSALQCCVSSRRTTTGISSRLFGCSVESDPFATLDCSPPGSSVHGVSQARILQWVVISFSRGSSRPRDQTTSPVWRAGSSPLSRQAACESACRASPPSGASI